MNVLNEATNRDLDTSKILMELGFLHGEQGDYKKMDDIFDQIVLKEKDPRFLLELANWYLEKNDYTDAERILKRGMGLSPQDERFFLKMKNLYLRKTSNQTATDFIGLFKSTEDVNTATIVNYKKLLDILRSKDIDLICMQYPRQSVTPLRMMLGEPNGVIFVENKNNFAEALQAMSFQQLFTDNFAGNFGHCTSQGNRLIAENLGKIILQEIRNSLK